MGKPEDSAGKLNMPWWSGVEVEASGEKIMVKVLYDFLDKVCRVPERPTSAPMRMPISGIYKIKGVGDVLAGRVEQGLVKPGEEVVFLPTHTASNPCTGKVFPVEMHHQRAEQAKPGDNVGLNIKGLVCDSFKNCEGLSRVAFMDGNGCVMLGKVISCERKEDPGAAGGKKK